MKKKILTLLLTAVMVLTLLPTTALAVEGTATTLNISAGSIIIDGTGASGGGLAGLTPLNPDGYIITQSPGVTANTISVATSTSLTLSNVNINVAAIDNSCAFSIASGADVSITLVGTNSLNSGKNCAGLQVPEGASVAISGANTLHAQGGYMGAGIGGGYMSNGGTVTINSGTVTANGGYAGAGIGGGVNGRGGAVTISNGTVTANGGQFGAGIGGGDSLDYSTHNTATSGTSGSGGTVTISGGIVTARGGYSAAGIGGGWKGSGGPVSISDGTLTATGGQNGAGIGGGWNGSGDTVTVSEGTVTATGGDYGAGIGGGNKASGGAINISGGTVTAASNAYGDGIGAGYTGTGGAVTISGGSVKAGSFQTQPNDGAATPTSVYLATLENLEANAAVASLTISKAGAPFAYGLPETVHSDGKLYLYLPANASTESYRIDVSAGETHKIGAFVESGGTTLLEPYAASFDKQNPVGITAAMTLNGNTLLTIMNGAKVLLLDTDYTVSGSTVTIEQSYLYDLPRRANALAFYFGSGAALNLDVTVTNSTPQPAPFTTSTLSQNTAGFNMEAQQDVPIGLNSNGNLLMAVKNGENLLVNGTHYILSGNTIVFKKEYLAQLPVGETVLTFTFSAGASQTLVITVEGVEAEAIPMTGEKRMPVLPFVMIVFVVLAMIVFARRKQGNL